MQEVSLVTNGHVEGLAATKDLVLQLMLMAAGVFAIFSGLASSAPAGAISRNAISFAAAFFGISLFCGYLAFGGIIASYDNESFNAYSPVIFWFGFFQLIFFLIGGIGLIVTIRNRFG